MKVLLSIKPEFALKIFEGTKRYEYRRSIFKRGGVRKIVVYASDPIKKIVGEFEIGGILHEEPQSLWDKTKIHAGISKDRFFEYFRDKPKGYAIEVKAIQIYDMPVTLRHFLIASPPQSFRYLG
ncbi:MAG: ASCH domain-containing protein [Deltaproteobacteria bacterium]|nr:ASCH domain-containing protein [Deltaproteobacteria bacterium]